MLPKNNRRDFFKISLATVALAATTKVSGQTPTTPKLHPLPPGAISLERFKSKCTACQLCVNQCSGNVLKASLFENGITGMMQPVMKFEIEEFCQYDCIQCIDVCPTGALTPMTIEEKKLVQVGIVRLQLEECIVIKDNEDCGACAEHCPTSALKMVPYKDGLTKPEIVAPKTCVGCGGCESICPTNKVAIYIERHDVHVTAEAPVVEKQEKVTFDDFGF